MAARNLFVHCIVVWTFELSLLERGRRSAACFLYYPLFKTTLSFFTLLEHFAAILLSDGKNSSTWPFTHRQKNKEVEKHTVASFIYSLFQSFFFIPLTFLFFLRFFSYFFFVLFWYWRTTMPQTISLKRLFFMNKNFSLWAILSPIVTTSWN